ncbi:ABC transporter permease [uncultured Friedmanniella sp.]|uniref:ABC transporter permease n=1 Tax=uncultured Friedmanniella sp. TaxID=335381 RepID=UPI0035CACC3B
MATQTPVAPAPPRAPAPAAERPSVREPRHRRRSSGLAGRRLVLAVLRPLGVFVPVFLFGTFVTFLLGELSGLSPAALQLGESATPEAIAQLEHNWGLDRPFWLRYADWFGHMLTGDFGRSWANNQSVAEQILQRASVSLSVAGLGLVIGIVGGLALGVLAVAKQGTLLDRGITAFATAISVMPAFVVGIVLVAVFAVGLGLLPSAGYVPLDRGFDKWIVHLVLPAVALSLDTVAEVARQLRVGLIQAYRENYVLGAVVRGLSGRRIFWVHALRNGLGPTLAVLGLKFANLLGGAVVLEQVFGLSGYGMFAAKSALIGDVPAVQGVLVVAVVMVVAFNVGVNVLLHRLIPTASGGV